MRESAGIIKYGGLLTFITMLVNGCNYLFHVYMSRKLGPSEYGILGSLLSLLVIISIPVGTIQLVIAKYVSSYSALGQYGKIGYLITRLSKKLFLLGLLGLITFIVGSNHLSSFLQIPLKTPLIIVGFVLLSWSLVPVSRGVLQGLQSFGHFGLNLFLDTFLRLTFGMLLVYFGLGVTGAIGASALSSFIAFVISIIPLRSFLKQKDQEVNTDFDSGELYRFFWPTVVSLLCFAILTNIDVVLVKHFFSSVEAGCYSAASLAGKIFLFLPGSLVMVLFPRVSQLEAQNRDPYAVFRLVFLLNIPISILGIMLYIYFPQIIILSLFGRQYLVIAPLLKLFGIVMTLFAGVNIMINYNLARYDLRFIYPLLTSVLVQIGLLMLFHTSLSQVIYLLLINGLWLLLFNYYLIQVGRKSYQTVEYAKL